jgi:SAM-dependent methyltransferase
VSDPRIAYAGLGDAWSKGPSALYDRLAEHLVAPDANELRGTTVLDAGAGTGAVCRALTRIGATAIALDTSADMLAHVGDAALLAVLGDVLAIPFLDATFEAAVSAFTISHVDAPELALAELRRVVRPHGLVLVSVFGAAPQNPSKDVVDEVAARYGYTRPAWYVHFKNMSEPRSNTPELLAASAARAGLVDIAVRDDVLDLGIDTPDAIVAYRTGHFHLAAFVASLTPAGRNALLDEARAAVAARGQPVRPRVLVLSSRAPA